MPGPGTKAQADWVVHVAGYSSSKPAGLIVQASRQAGLRQVDILVEDMDDDEMIRLMCVENATQRGAVAAAVLNEVAAATRRLASVLLHNVDMAPFGAMWPNQKAVGRRICPQRASGLDH